MTDPRNVVDQIIQHLNALAESLSAVESALDRLTSQKIVKDWYTTAEVAKLLGRAEFTVREWCRLKRINAKKRPCGRGLSAEWAVAHTELQRIQNEGLLPVR